MNHRMKKRLKRVGGLALCLCVLLSCLPGAAFAVTAEGLCDHHPAHTEECGYMEGEQPCGYVCEECAAAPEEEPGEEPEKPAPDETPQEEPAGKLEVEPVPEYHAPAPISDAGALTEETAAVKVVSGGTTTYYASFDDLVAVSLGGTEDITVLKDTSLKTACTKFGCKSLTVNTGVTLTLNADLSFKMNEFGNTPVSGGGTIAGTGTLTACGDVSGLTVFCPLATNVSARGAISSGTFSNSVTISSSTYKIAGGIFSGTVNVENGATIEGGTFNGIVNSNSIGYIKGGTFTGTVNNASEIYKGTFSGTVNNNEGTIIGGTFGGSVENKSGIEGGIFDCTVKNFLEDGYISGGTFNGQIINYCVINLTETSSITLGEDFSIINYGEVLCTAEHFKNASDVCRLCGDGCTHASWKDGICEICGTVCKHENYKTGKCTVCGYPCPHTSYEDGKCTLCGSYQPPEQIDGVYQIGNANQLCWFAEFVNAGNTSANAVLTADIDLTGIDWIPIGLYSDDPTVTTSRKNTSYAGTFNGQYHVIFNLNVDMSATNYEAGLFSRVVSGGELKNFGIVNATITQTSNGHENKGVRAGVVAGEIFGGTVTNVFTAGNLAVSTNHEQSGGIAGECASSTLTSCHTTYGILTTKVSVDSYVPTITRCYYKADTANSNSYGGYKTEAAFASGAVTFEMNSRSESGVWKQTIGTDKYPNFTGKTVGNGVYGYYNPLDESDIQSVSITWGAMAFTYTDGGWNTETYTYDQGGWTASGNTVKVANDGTATVKATVSYENAVGYTFAADWSKKTAEISGGTDYTFTMNLSGQPTSALSNTTIGTVTVTLTDTSTPIGWVVDNGNMNYYENGKLVTAQTKTIDGVEYYFVDCLIFYGKTKLNGKWYHCNDIGSLVKGWIPATENGTRVYYYAKEDYSLAMNETLEINGATYYFNADGHSDKAPPDNRDILDIL